MRICFSDLETANEEPISRGSYRYAETVRIQLWAYAFDDGPVKVWDAECGEPMPADLKEGLEDPSVFFCWHNQSFDRIQLLHGLGIVLPPERVIDTMVIAYQHSLPGKLDELCKIYKLPADLAKQKRGRYLVQLFCKPRGKKSKIKWATPQTHPAEWAEYKEYATHDVLAMRELYRLLPKVNCSDKEREIWLLDQKINDRGFAVDVELAQAALEAVDKAKASLSEDVQEKTGGRVRAATQRDAMMEHILQEHGIYLKDMRASTLEKYLDDPEIPEPVKELLRNRLSASTTSVSKYKAFLAVVSSDGRARGTIQYCGAGRTGRWAGRKIQPQNFPRPKLKQKVIDEAIEAIKGGWINDCAGIIDPIDACAAAIRGTIAAPPGKKLVVADLSAIEGRMVAWLAGEEWRLQAFRDFDAGLVKYDDYQATYAAAFSVDPMTVGQGDKRQIGKVMALMLAYEGGVGAYLTGAATYRIDLQSMGEEVKMSMDLALWEEAADFLGFIKKVKGKTFGIEDDTFIACDALKRAWRYANVATVRLWSDLKNAFIDALRMPGETFRAGKLEVFKDGRWVFIRLPSGRCLCYPGAKVEYQANGKPQLSYMGINQYTRQWERVKTYGGKLVENATQAAARDVLAWSMPLVENAGYEIVTSIHDELVTETPDSDVYSAETLSSLMCTVHPWAKGLPLAAHGFESYRYKKG